MCALWGLLERAAKLGTDSEPMLLKGCELVVRALMQSSLRQGAADREFVQATFSVVMVLAGCHSLPVLAQMREHRDLIKSVLEVTMNPQTLRFHELVTSCRLVASLWGIVDLVALLGRHQCENDDEARCRFVMAACCAINDGAYESDEVEPCALTLIRIVSVFLHTMTSQGIRECTGQQLSAPAGTLGVAIAHISEEVMKLQETQELVYAALRQLLELTRYASELFCNGFELLHHTHWAMREAVFYSAAARQWVTAQPEAVALMQQSVQSLVQDAGDGKGTPADRDVDAKRALTEGLSMLTLLQGPGIAIVAMGRCPNSRVVQIAGCAALRDAAQRGMLDPQCQDTRNALHQACQVCVNEPEVEAAAFMALGLLGAC